MNPVVAIVGRPNVGKSTLFNRLTRRRDALVADQPGLTRDRHYGYAELAGHRCIVVDTGGLGEASDEIDALMEEQALQAVSEADVVLFVVDGSTGLTPADEEIARLLRRRGKPVLVAANKSEGREATLVGADFQFLGFRDLCCIAAAHGQGIQAMAECVAALLPQGDKDSEGDEEAGPSAESAPRIAVVGRPNVGKSTLINRLLGEERVIAFDEPGTTRDSIYIPFERDGQSYLLIDTAGVRRRSRIHDVVEKFSVIKSLQVIADAHVVIMVLDARQEVAEQDARLLGLIKDAGRALVIAVNKWDGLSGPERARIRCELDRRLAFVDYAEQFFISALHGTGVGEMFRAVEHARIMAGKTFPTAYLTRLLEEAVMRFAPPLVRGRRIKLRYAHQGGRYPLKVVIHGNQTAMVPANYRRYLENYFREALGIVGTPIRIEFRTSDNPFKGRRNRLTPRQMRKRKRIRGR